MTADTPIGKRALAASTGRGWRRYPDFPASAQTVADRHLSDVPDVEAWYEQHDTTPGRHAT